LKQIDAILSITAAQQKKSGEINRFFRLDRGKGS